MSMSPTTRHMSASCSALVLNFVVLHMCAISGGKLRQLEGCGKGKGDGTDDSKSCRQNLAWSFSMGSWDPVAGSEGAGSLALALSSDHPVSPSRHSDRGFLLTF